jgi:hypothetical protein
MENPLPASWNGKNVTRRELQLLGLADLEDGPVRRRQRVLAAIGLWFLAGAIVLAALADVLGWAVESWSPLLAVPGIFMLLRAWEMRQVRLTRRVLRRLKGLDPN